MIPISKLQLGHLDAENYKRRENKNLFNKIFVRTKELDKICESGSYFLIGEKGSGKTAYAVFLQNSSYKGNSSFIKYIRETDYQKFVTLKQKRHLELSDYTNIWKVVIYLLLSEQISLKEKGNSLWGSFTKFSNLKRAIDEYYKNAFSPEIINAIQFASEAEIGAQILSKHVNIGAKKKEQVSFSKSQFQTNLFYIQRCFEDALRSLKLNQNYILFIDGIDIRPGSIPYSDYSECIKGLANAIWSLNNDFFSSIKDSKGRLRVVLLIRPDIFDSLGLQNQNSKLRDNSVVLNWLTTYSEYHNSPLFKMACRLLSFQQPHSISQREAWDHYFPFDAPSISNPDVVRPSSFVSFLRYSMYRPRDILQILAILKENFSQQGRTHNQVFNVDEFTNPMFTRKYSDYLLGEVKDHLTFYYSTYDWKIFLKYFQCLRGKWDLSYQDFCESYDEFVSFLKRNKDDIPKFAETPDKLLQFMYDLNILCYIVETEREPFFGWCCRERTNTNIAPSIRIGVNYKIHFGLRKALDLGQRFKK